jgi:hypothetical protein
MHLEVYAACIDVTRSHLIYRKMSATKEYESYAKGLVLV